MKTIMVASASALILALVPITSVHAQTENASYGLDLQEILLDILNRYGQELYLRGDLEEAAYVFHTIRSYNDRHPDARKFIEKIRQKDPNISIPNLDPNTRRAIARRIDLIEERVIRMSDEGRRTDVDTAEIERLAAAELTGTLDEMSAAPAGLPVGMNDDALDQDRLALQQIRTIEAAYRDELERAIEESRSLSKILKQKNDELLLMQDEYDAKDRALEEEVDIYREQIARLRREANELRYQLGDVRAAKMDIEREIRTKDDELAALAAKQEEYDRLRHENRLTQQALAEQLRAAEERIARLNKEIAELQKQMKEPGSLRTAVLEPPVIEKVRTRPMALKTAIDRRQDKALRKQTSSSEREIAELEESIEQKDALLRDYKMQIASLSAIIEMRSDKYGTVMAKLGKELARKNMLLEASGTLEPVDITGGTDIETAAMIDSLEDKEREIAMLKRKLTQAQASAEILRDQESPRIESEVAQLREKLAETELQVHEAGSTLDDKSGQLSTLQSKFDDLEGRLKLVQQLLDKKNKEIATLQAELDRLNAESSQ